jgi:predicted esterase/tetratricopeptide (TPR) repeat protein
MPFPEAALVVALAVPLPSAYFDVVDRYRSGDHHRAVQEVLVLDPGGLHQLSTRVVPPRGIRAPRVTDIAIVKIREALPAAVMLHTQAGLVLRWQNDPSGAWAQWRIARTLSEADPETPSQAEFLKAWYHAVGLFHLGSYEGDQAIEVLARGRERFPDDLPLALALAQAHEARVAHGVGRDDARDAESMYRELIARRPPFAEARLRLGNVLDMSGRVEAALSELHAAAGETGDPRIRYLAHLFSGDLLRRASRRAEAEEEFSLALAAWPGGEAAALSLAETLHATGRREAAASVLASSIAADAPTPGPDPFRTYYFGDRDEHKRLLEALVDRVSTTDTITSGTFSSERVTRTYSVYAPPSAAARPLVILLHGWGGDGRQMVARWSSLASREGFIAAAPDATDPREWQPPQDGPTLFRDLVEALKPQRIDMRRIYLFGYSAGGVFALHVGPLEPAYFAAVAVHAAAFGGEADLGFLDTASRKIPVLVSAGTKDKLFPPSHVEATVRRLERAGFPVETAMVGGGEHAYQPSDEINERAWTFLRRHALPADPAFVPVRFERDARTP